MKFPDCRTRVSLNVLPETFPFNENIVLLSSRSLLIVSTWRKAMPGLGSFLLIFLLLSSPPSEPLSFAFPEISRGHGGRWKLVHSLASNPGVRCAIQFSFNFMCIWRYSVHTSLSESATLWENEAQNLKERSEKEALKRKRVVKQGEWLPFCSDVTCLRRPHSF
jgi:hypothetical protein